MHLSARTIVGGLSILFVSSGAFAAGSTLLTFQPQSTSSAPEIIWGPDANQGNALTLHSGTGAIGNGDGAQGAAGLTPGLTLNTPLTIAPSVLGEQHNPDGSTTFYDVTLSLTGLGPDAPAVNDGTDDYQSLGAGTFAFYSSKPGGGPGTLLLSGRLVNTLTNGIDGSPSSSGVHYTFIDNSVTYTGGLIYDQLVSQRGGVTGNESISLLNITPSLSINSTAGSPNDTYLNNFTANATGLFTTTSITPEPVSAALVVVGFSLATLRRRRRTEG